MCVYGGGVGESHKKRHELELQVGERQPARSSLAPKRATAPSILCIQQALSIYLFPKEFLFREFVEAQSFMSKWSDLDSGREKGGGESC
jgi:hypothetical protein